MRDNIEDTHAVFAAALRDMNAWVRGIPARVPLSAPPYLLVREAFPQRIVLSDVDGFDHRLYDKQFVIGRGLLQAYWDIWERLAVTKADRKLCAQLFLTHELVHHTQCISSDKGYRIAGTSTRNVFIELDYDADALALQTCYYMNRDRRQPRVLWCRLLHAQLIGGAAFGRLDAVGARYKSKRERGVAIGGKRLRRQLTWAFQYVRAQTFGNDCLHWECALNERVEMRVFRMNKRGLGKDICDRPLVYREDLRSPLHLQLTTAGKLHRYTLAHPSEAEPIAQAIFDGGTQWPLDAFRTLLGHYPGLTGLDVAEGYASCRHCHRPRRDGEHDFFG